MENQRLLLYFSLCFVMFLLWQAWQQDYGPQPRQQIQEQQAGEYQDQGAIPDPAQEVGTVQKPGSTADVPSAPDLTSVASKVEIEKTQRRQVHVVTDVVDVLVDTQGGNVVSLKLRQYPLSSAQADEPFVLLFNGTDELFVAQSGLVSRDSSAPNHNSVYTAEASEYRLGEGVDELVVPLHWRGDDGTTVDKILRFQRGSYAIDVEHHVRAGSDNWSASQYRQLLRTLPNEENSSRFIYTYTGGVVFNDEIKYEKIDFDDIASNEIKNILQDSKMPGGWLAMIQHYFLTAWVPASDEENLVYTKNPGNRYILGMRSPVLQIDAGQQGVFKSRLVAGPKLQGQLEKIATGLELTVDYGVLTIIAKPLFWLLNVYHGWLQNWGWAIIFLTMTIKLIFYKLSETSYKSMAKMRKVAPRLKAMKERFGDDRQAMSKAMMELYKKEKINPLGGCFPILVQIPVFIALYWVLLESVEMRDAPFMLWINNLSEKDPYFVLPVVMGVTMFLQQKLNPAPMDPMQQKIFQIMPFVFTFFFAFFPSGLVLYWVVNNVLSIIQQWVITRRIENA